MTVGQLPVATFVTSVFLNVQANIATGAQRKNTDILFTNFKLPTIHSESLPTSRSKASVKSYAEKLELLLR